MIMRPGQQLLLPAKPLFIWTSMALALGVNIVLNVAFLGRSPWMPDLTALVLMFWLVHQPNRVGMISAFLLGLLMDVHQGSLLGQHALAYSVLGYLAGLMQRRLLWFGLLAQTIQVLPLLAAGHAVALVVRIFVGGKFPGYPMLLAPVIEALLWPVVSMLLLIPQKRAPVQDENRPL